MKKVYEAWQYNEGCAIVFGESESIKSQFAQGLIPSDAKPLHKVEASYYEEAMQLHYDKMEW